MGRAEGGPVSGSLAEGRIGTGTYPVVWVREILRAAVEGFKVKGLLLVEGDHFGKRSSMILTEHLTLSVDKKKEECSKKKKQSQAVESQHSQHILYLQAG